MKKMLRLEDEIISLDNVRRISMVPHMHNIYITYNDNSIENITSDAKTVKEKTEELKQIFEKIYKILQENA